MTTEESLEDIPDPRVDNPQTARSAAQRIADAVERSRFEAQLLDERHGGHMTHAQQRGQKMYEDVQGQIRPVAQTFARGIERVTQQPALPGRAPMTAAAAARTAVHQAKSRAGLAGSAPKPGRGIVIPGRNYSFGNVPGPAFTPIGQPDFRSPFNRERNPEKEQPRSPSERIQDVPTGTLAFTRALNSQGFGLNDNRLEFNRPVLRRK